MNFEHFTFLELIRTDTGMNNLPSTLDQVENLVALGYLLEDIRADYGAPIVVTSAFRTPLVNNKVGGVLNSFHLQGRAADIRPLHYPSKDYLWNFLNLLDVVKAYEDVLEEIIVDPNSRYIHIAI
jgi:hypothetical protein